MKNKLTPVPISEKINLKKLAAELKSIDEIVIKETGKTFGEFRDDFIKESVIKNK